jgi:hypothetical protein
MSVASRGVPARNEWSTLLSADGTRGKVAAAKDLRDGRNEPLIVVRKRGRDSHVPPTEDRIAERLDEDVLLVKDAAISGKSIKRCTRCPRRSKSWRSINSEPALTCTRRSGTAFCSASIRRSGAEKGSV